MPGTTQGGAGRRLAPSRSPPASSDPAAAADDGLRTVNVYAVTDDDRPAIVDSGWAHRGGRERPWSPGWPASAGRRATSRRFLVTHVHRDHYTLAVPLRREFDRPSASARRAGPRSRSRSCAGSNGKPQSPHAPRGAGALAALAGGAQAQPPIRDWNGPTTGSTRRRRSRSTAARSRSSPTPGPHARPRGLPRRRRGILFAGDHVLPHITPSIGFEPSPGAPRSATTWARSGRPHAARRPPVAGPRPRAPAVHDRVDELLEHHEERLNASSAALTAGATTGHEVARILTWTRRGRAFDDLDVFNRDARDARDGRAPRAARRPRGAHVADRPGRRLPVPGRLSARAPGPADGRRAQRASVPRSSGSAIPVTCRALVRREPGDGRSDVLGLTDRVGQRSP